MLFLLTAIFYNPSLALAENPVAVLSDIKGDVKLIKPSGSILSLLSTLSPGQQVKLEKGSELTLVYLAGSKEFIFKGPAEIQIGKDMAKVLHGKPASKRILLASLDQDMIVKQAGKSQASMTMRSSGSEDSNGLELFTPVRTRLLSIPEFKWTDAKNNGDYNFELVSETGDLIYDNNLHKTKHKLPGDVSIPLNETLTWEIETKVGTRTITSFADFSVVDDKMRAKVERNRPKAGATFSQKVFFAMFLDSLELHLEARKVWKGLAKERKNDPMLKKLSQQS